MDAADPQDTREQAIVVFYHAAEEIRFFKLQQWRVTNYTLLAIGALTATALSDRFREDLFWTAACLAIVATASITGCYLLRNLSKALGKEGDRMQEARTRLPLVDSTHEKFKRSVSELPVSVFLGLAVMLSAALSWTVVLLPWADRLAACIDGA